MKLSWLVHSYFLRVIPVLFPCINMPIVSPHAIPRISACVISYFRAFCHRHPVSFATHKPRLFRRGFHAGLLLTCSCYHCSFCYSCSRLLYSTSSVQFAVCSRRFTQHFLYLFAPCTHLGFPSDFSGTSKN